MPAHMLLRIFHLAGSALMHPYTLHALTFVWWVAFVWIAYHRQSWIAAIAIGPAFHLFMMVSHRMVHAGYYGSNPFKASDRSDDK